MSAPTEEHPVLDRYDSILTGGVDQYRDGDSLRALLTDDFLFDGPIAGRMAGGDRFIHGVRGFIETVRAITMIQAVFTAAGAATLYDAQLPYGTVRFSEFFEFDGDKIPEVRIQYNAAEYRARGGL